MFIRLRRQCVLIPILITLMFSGSLFFTKNQQMSVYYVKTTVRTTENPFSVTPIKHVTKSLEELGKMDDINKFVLLVNQIPNCGAEVLVFLIQRMQGPNNYRHVRLKGKSDGIFNRIEQEEFIDELYKIMRNEAVPLSFDRQVYFVNFTSFDRQSPTYINLIREPADKALSRSLYRSKHEDTNNDLIQCLIRGNDNCTTLTIDAQQLTIPYFCGHDPRCLLNNQWALEAAKTNVEKYYAVVGILEEMNATLEVMEHEVPYFFKGVQEVYKNKMIDKFIHKKSPHPHIKKRKRLKQILAKEYEFYNWVKRRLFKQLQLQYGDHSTH